jgi:hypothetical protein
MHEVSRQRREPIVLSISPTIFDRDVFALDITQVAQAQTKCTDSGRRLAWRSAAKEPDHGHGGLLRVRGARPGERRAAQRQYEFPPSNIDRHLTGPRWGRVVWNKKTIARLSTGGSVT